MCYFKLLYRLNILAITLILLAFSKANASAQILSSSSCKSISDIMSKVVNDDVKEVIIDNTVSIDTNITIPKDITLSFLPGGNFVKNAHGSLLIYADIKAGYHQIFNNFMPGDIIFNSSTPTLIPQWWGAKGDGLNDDSLAINSAIASIGYTTSKRGEHHSVLALGGGASVILKRGNYAIKSTLVLRPLSTIIGNGSKLIYIGETTADVIRNANTSVKPFEVTPPIYDSNSINIQDLIIDGNHRARNGIYFKRVTDSRVQGVTIFNVMQDGLHLEQCQWNQLSSLFVSRSGRHGLYLGGAEDEGKRSNNNLFLRCKFEGSGRLETGHGAYIINGHNNSFFGCTFQFGMEALKSNATRSNCGIVIDKDTISNIIESCHFEHNFYHVMIMEGSIGTSVIGSYFAAGSTQGVPKRFVVNSGISTAVFNCSSQNDSIVSTFGTNAPYQQNTDILKSSMSIYGGNIPNGTNSRVCFFKNGACINSYINPRISVQEF